MILQKHITGNIVARLLSTFFNFLIVLMVSRSLGPLIKGETTLLVTAIFIVVFAANFAGGYALVNVLHRQDTAAVLLPSYIWSAFVAFFAFAFIEGFSFNLRHHAVHIAMLAFISSITGTHQVILMSRNKLTQHNVLVVAPVLFNFAFLSLFLYGFHWKNIGGFLAAMYAALTLNLLLSLVFVRNLPDLHRLWFSLEKFKTILHSGFRFQAVELLQLLHLRLYFFLLSSFQENGLYQLGIYSVGISILEAVWIFGRGVATMNYAATVKSPSAFQTLRHLRTTLWVSATCIVLIFLIPVEVYAFVFGEGFTYVKYSVKYLFPGIGFYCVVLVLGSHLMGREKYGNMAMVHLAGILVSSVLCLIWIPKYEMSGAGLAATVSFAFAALLALYFFLRDTKMKVADLFRFAKIKPN